MSKARDLADSYTDSEIDSLDDLLAPKENAVLTGQVALSDDRYSYYTDRTTYALDARNSDIVGLNGLYWNDESNNNAEGLLFPRATTVGGLADWSSLRAYQDVLYFSPNADSTSHKVWHEGNDGAGSGLDADKLQGFIPDGYNSATTICRRDVNGSLLGTHVMANNGAFTTSVSGGLDTIETSTNVDHIWHDESSNTWSFCSDAAYKSAGNSNIAAGKIRLASTTDVSFASTDHAFQIGSDTGYNIVMDANEILSRNNGAAADLFINLDSGNVCIGSAPSISKLNVNGSISAQSYLRAGYEVAGEDSVNAYGTDSTDRTSMVGLDVADNSDAFAVLINNIRYAQLDGDGDMTIAGTLAQNTTADYAEMFEWLDGNPHNEDRVGYSVALVEDKIKIAEEGDNVIGIISATPAILGDSGGLFWVGMNEKDEFGREVLVDIPVLKYVDPKEGDYKEMRISKYLTSTEVLTKEILDAIIADYEELNGVLLEDVSVVYRKEAKKSDNYDPNVNYVPREDRPEWSPVGLLGKLYMRKGQIVNPNWIKLKDHTTKVERWLVK